MEVQGSYNAVYCQSGANRFECSFPRGSGTRDLNMDYHLEALNKCLSNRSCWGVTYTSRRVCALVGSTVDIHSSYSHPTGYTVEKTYWHYLHHGKFSDLREDPKFAGRVEYMDNTLRIKNVKKRDAGEYRFRIITNKNSYSGSPGVILTVTGTKVKSSPDPVIDGEKVILSCSTRCTLDSNIMFFWYKNGHPVTDGVKLYNKLYLDSVNKKELKQYSCTLRDVQSKVPKKSMATRIIILLLSVFLIIAVIGVLYCRRRRKYISSQKCDNTNPAIQPKSQPDSSTLDNSTPLYTVSDFTHQTQSDEQIIHYSSIHFKQPYKTTSCTPTVIYESIEDVHYSTLKLK
ncbi:uncharacterized protein [Misgurnus anguillicaudatus]|uniref:uncharacterized protein n=1 Tax=Misgurnus anguillicaudatus TaxID=75329 RepID=UPI003CCFC3AA